MLSCKSSIMACLNFLDCELVSERNLWSRKRLRVPSWREFQLEHWKVFGMYGHIWAVVRQMYSNAMAELQSFSRISTTPIWPLRNIGHHFEV